MPEHRVVHSQAFTISDFFTSDECDIQIALAESAGFSDAPINSMLGPQVRKDVRNNTRVMLDDPVKAEEVWTRVRGYLPLRIGNWLACGVNERFRYYRYDVGQQFDWHYDGSFERENGERSQLTFMVYLNDGSKAARRASNTLTSRQKKAWRCYSYIKSATRANQSWRGASTCCGPM